MPDCIFCRIPQEEIFLENEHALAFFDRYPVNEGHLLIIPKRHAETFFDATEAEQIAINKLIVAAKAKLDQRFHPDGYNIGVNVNVAAGQTIFHLHIHLIPRYLGDVADPRGGIRKIKKSLVSYAEEGET